MKKQNQNNNKLKAIAIFFIIVITLLIVTPFSLFGNKAFIGDYIVGSPYEVVSVDGKPPERAKHGIAVTVVPLVKVTEGKHTLTLQEKDIDSKNINDPIENVEINVKARKRYRLVTVNGLPVVELENRQ
jgi:hypothetical protein